MKLIQKYYIYFVKIGLSMGVILSLYVIYESALRSQWHLVVFAALCFMALATPAILIRTASDYLSSQATERTLRCATSTLDEMRKGLNMSHSQSVCEILLPETSAIAVAITDTEKILGYAGIGATNFPIGQDIKTPATLEVIKSAKMQTFNGIIHSNLPSGIPDEDKKTSVIPAGIVVPLLVQERVVGTLKFFYDNRRDIDRTQLAIAWGFGQILSMELSQYELDKQAELTARAEVKALQAQINPHFLFNTLNTIASLTRTDPLQARDLLREFAFFYRQTLENSESKIPITKEIEQTKRYLKFEHARFGEDRIVAFDQIEDSCCNVKVPAFVIQPLVENAVRHAMRDVGTLHINILVAQEGNDCLISVVDDGLGMNEQTALALIGGDALESGSKKGCGVALHNVAERIEKFYGVGSGVEIMSKPDEGTCVTLRLANALVEKI